MSLAELARIIGGVILVINLIGVFAPDMMIRGAKALPRNQLSGWLLAALNLFWVAWIVHHAFLGRFEFLKPFIYIAAPAGFLLIVFFMDELLTARMLGGLLLLIANPVLIAARWNPTPWRLVMTVLAYIWVIAGITFVLSPFRFRQFIEFVTKREKWNRGIFAVRAVIGAAIIYLGLFVY